MNLARSLQSAPEYRIRILLLFVVDTISHIKSYIYTYLQSQYCLTGIAYLSTSTHRQIDRSQKDMTSLIHPKWNQLRRQGENKSNQPTSLAQATTNNKRSMHPSPTWTGRDAPLLTGNRQSLGIEPTEVVPRAGGRAVYRDGCGKKRGGKGERKRMKQEAVKWQEGVWVCVRDPCCCDCGLEG